MVHIDRALTIKCKYLRQLENRGGVYLFGKKMCFVHVRFSGHADEGSVLQGWWPARSFDQRAAGGPCVLEAVLRPGTGGRRGQHNQLLHCGLQRWRDIINSKFSRSSRGNLGLCSIWAQRLEGNSSLKNSCVAVDTIKLQQTSRSIVLPIMSKDRLIF